MVDHHRRTFNTQTLGPRFQARLFFLLAGDFQLLSVAHEQLFKLRSFYDLETCIGVPDHNVSRLQSVFTDIAGRDREIDAAADHSEWIYILS